MQPANISVLKCFCADHGGRVQGTHRLQTPRPPLPGPPPTPQAEIPRRVSQKHHRPTKRLLHKIDHPRQPPHRPTIVQKNFASFAPLRELSFLTENSIAAQVVDAAYRIHVALGPGLLESVYQHILAAELADRGLHVDLQRPIPILYRGLEFEIGFRADMIVENRVIVEIKSVEAVHPVHKKQLLTYLRLADKRLGLMINFNVELIKDGISRVVNNLGEERISRQGAKAQSS